MNYRINQRLFIVQPHEGCFEQGEADPLTDGGGGKKSLKIASQSGVVLYVGQMLNAILVDTSPAV